MVFAKHTAPRGSRVRIPTYPCSIMELIIKLSEEDIQTIEEWLKPLWKDKIRKSCFFSGESPFVEDGYWKQEYWHDKLIYIYSSCYIGSNLVIEDKITGEQLDLDWSRYW